jgi:hypothetical protein
MKKHISFLFFIIFYIARYSYAVQIDYNGTFILRTIKDEFRTDSILNPNFALVEPYEYEYNIYLNFLSKVCFTESLELRTKIRPYWSKIENKDEYSNKVYFDELYLNFYLLQNLYISLGKQNLITGVGLSYNPSDFFGEKKDVDTNLKKEEQRYYREGDYIIRCELFKDNMSFSVSFAPKIYSVQDLPNRIETEVSLMFGNTDLSCSFFYSDTQKVGLNISKTIGEKVELHCETGYYTYVEKKLLKIKTELGQPNSNVYEYEIEQSYNQGVRNVIGGHYTTSNKTNFIIEYFYNQTGYTKEEWEKFVKIIESNKEYFLSPPVGFNQELFKYNLYLANSLMNYGYMRQHYLFVSIWNPEVFVFDITCGMLLNLEDKSFVFLPNIEYKIVKGFFSLILSGNFLHGGQNSEFGLCPVKEYYNLELRVYF